MVSNQKTSRLSSEERSGERWPRFISISTSAFMMSLAATLISGYHAMRGPIILVRSPFSVVLLKSGQENSAPLAVAVTIPMMNTTVSYSDVVTSARIETDGPLGTFPVDSIVDQEFARSGTMCKPDAVGCVSLPGLSMNVRSGEILDLPGGSKEVRTFLFVGKVPFDKAVSLLSNNRALTLSLHIESYSDGDHEVSCKIKPDVSFMTHIGWTSAPCSSANEPGRLF